MLERKVLAYQRGNGVDLGDLLGVFPKRLIDQDRRRGGIRLKAVGEG